MKSKKIFLLIITIIIVIALVACSNKIGSTKFLEKEGIKPYKLSQSEEYILQTFGMEGNSQIISFDAPKEVITLKVNVYKLEDNKEWSNIGGGGTSIGKDREPVEQLSGTFAMQLRENHAINFNINVSGRASYLTDEIILDKEIMSSMKVFLQEFQEIEINEEIPIALMVYDGGTEMRTYSIQDYFEPSKFDGMDLVQVVTLTFTDKEL